jgi:hypothetical protein
MLKIVDAPIRLLQRLTRWQLIFWLIVTIFIIFSFLAYIWLTLIRVQTKIVSGVNLYRHPIQVIYNNQTFNLDMFDTFSTATTATGDTVAQIKDENGNNIATKIYSLGRQASITLDFYAQNDEVKECFVEATVTKFFYPELNVDSDVSKIVTLQNTPASSFNYVIGDAQDFYLYFGNYNGKDLPASFKSYLSVRGIYPVNCANLGDQEKIKAEIVWWSNYDPAKQRELYQQALQQVVSSKEYNQ